MQKKSSNLVIWTPEACSLNMMNTLPLSCHTDRCAVFKISHILNTALVSACINASCNSFCPTRLKVCRKLILTALKPTTVQESMTLYKEIQNVQNTTIKARNN